MRSAHCTACCRLVCKCHAKHACNSMCLHACKYASVSFMHMLVGAGRRAWAAYSTHWALCHSIQAPSAATRPISGMVVKHNMDVAECDPGPRATFKCHSALQQVCEPTDNDSWLLSGLELLHGGRHNSCKLGVGQHNSMHIIPAPQAFFMLSKSAGCIMYEHVFGPYAACLQGGADPRYSGTRPACT